MVFSLLWLQSLLFYGSPISWFLQPSCLPTLNGERDRDREIETERVREEREFNRVNSTVGREQEGERNDGGCMWVRDMESGPPE